MPSDDLENSMIEQTRANSGLTSRSSAIMRLDGCTREEADEEMERIKREAPPPQQLAKPVSMSGQDISNASKQGGIEKAPLMPDIVSTLKDIGYFKTNSG